MAIDTNALEEDIPLCVDLDGTLVKTDTLVESALLLVKKNPFNVFAMLRWLVQGKAHLKDQIAERTDLNVALLPYNTDLLAWLNSVRDTRRIVLVTAANQKIANAVAQHLQVFSKVIASSPGQNLSGTEKRDELDKLYGPGGYDYAGNSPEDLHVWKHSHQAVVVDAKPSVLASVRATSTVARVYSSDQDTAKMLLKAMRPRQWIKNLLVFVNILMAHQLGDMALMASTFAAFIAFCLCASAVYLMNDLLDLDADRGHSTKRHRVFAGGKLQPIYGVVAAPALLLAAFAFAAIAGGVFPMALLAYFVVTVLYSLLLKRIVILDVLVLAMLYTLRIVAGAAVAVVMPSFWLLSFAMFIFGSLAMAKRYAELKMLQRESSTWASGRGYHVGDLALISSLGVASGYIATLVLALYVNSPDVLKLYGNASYIWLLCPLLMYWIGRIWLLASRGVLDQDPVIFATRDPVSYLVGFFSLLILWAAI
ncbi:MAG: UbiA family prenyltransferase [Halioglobus sp.]